MSVAIGVRPSRDAAAVDPAPPGADRAGWVKSISAIREEDWRACFGPYAVKSYGFHRAVEEAALPGVEFHYLTLARGGTVQAIFPCFVFGVELDLLAEGFLAAFLKRVKSAIPGLMTKRIFFAGTPVAICDLMWGIRPQGSQSAARALEMRALEEIRRRTRSERCLITILKEIPMAQRERFRSLIGNGYFLAESLPNSYILTGSGESASMAGLRKKYRSRIRGSLRKFSETGFTWEIRRDFAQYAEILEALYLQVLGKSKTKFERLTAGFFRNAAARLGDAAFCIIGRDGNGRIICFEFVVEEEDAIVPMYLGIDYAFNGTGDLYFNCIYRIVEEAERRGKRLIKLGQTSYEAKAYTGAVFERLFLAIDAPNPALRLILRALSPMLFPRLELPLVRSHRDEVVPRIEAELAAFGIEHEKMKSTEEET